MHKERYRSGHNEADSKSVSQVKLARGFESHSFRHIIIKEEKMDNRKKEIIKHSVAISILIIIISIVATIIIKYQVDGETNMPFELSRITIISTAEGESVEPKEGEETYKWNMEVNQSNDVYFFIDKNEQYKKNAMIDSVEIENINITKQPLKGTIKTYMPNSSAGRLYSYDESFLVTNKLTYTGAKSSDEKNLQIGNQGGKVLIRFANTGICTYTSNDDTEIVHDGTLISKCNITEQEINFTVNFDFIITVGNIKYKANITLELPCESITTEGTTQIEKKDMSDIIFKRI